mgnify:CR=1 FL=1
MTTTPIRKGQFCAVGERHSSTMMHGATGSSWSYTIGRVRKASAKGDKIKEATVYRYGTEIRMREDEQPRFWQSYTVPPHAQERAGELLGQEWDNIEYMREAFRA